MTIKTKIRQWLGVEGEELEELRAANRRQALENERLRAALKRVDAQLHEHGLALCKGEITTSQTATPKFANGSAGLRVITPNGYGVLLRLKCDMPHSREWWVCLISSGIERFYSEDNLRRDVTVSARGNPR